MNRKNAGIAFALCLLTAASVGADSDKDKVRNCIAEWTTSCPQQCGDATCVSQCTTMAQSMCREHGVKDITQQQHIFIGPVRSLPTTNCDGAPQAPACTPFVNQDVTSPPPPTCWTVTGTVAKPAFRGGVVTVRVVCPPGTPAGHQSETTTTSTIGQALSNCDGSFTIKATGTCSGETGCYALITIDAPDADSCQACGNCGQAAAGDPGWNTCTDTCCPTP